MTLGRMILIRLKKPDVSPYLAYGAGIVVVFLLALVPVLGTAVRLFAAVAGGGAIVLSRFSFLKQLKAAGTI
jgi:hypothetical protein